MQFVERDQFIPLSYTLPIQLLLVFNAFIVELVIICVYVCLLCQDTQINEYHVCSLFVWKMYTSTGLKYARLNKTL